MDCERIWLQTGDITTWCQNIVHEDDVEYVRADIHAALKRENKALRANCSKSVLRRLDIQLRGVDDETE